MECGACGSENLYDNREKVAGGWRGPLWKCKDCDWVKWPPKNQRSGGGGQQRQGGGQRGNGGGTPKNSRPLGPLYYDCLKVAKACVEKQLKTATPADIIAATATLFIAATRDGTPLDAPKPKPEPEQDDRELVDDYDPYNG